MKGPLAKTLDAWTPICRIVCRIYVRSQWRAKWAEKDVLIGRQRGGGRQSNICQS